MSDRSSTRILVIDDEQPLRQGFKFYLENYNFEVLEAENGRVGIEVFDRAGRPAMQRRGRVSTAGTQSAQSEGGDKRPRQAAPV